MTDTSYISDVLIYVQRALLGKVTPNLRAVRVAIESKQLHLSLVYDQPLSDIEKELTNLIDIQFRGSFPSPEWKTDCTIKILPFPERIPNEGHTLYFRCEE